MNSISLNPVPLNNNYSTVHYGWPYSTEQGRITFSVLHVTFSVLPAQVEKESDLDELYLEPAVRGSIHGRLCPGEADQGGSGQPRDQTNRGRTNI